MSHSSALFVVVLFGVLFFLGVGIWIGFLIGFSKALRDVAARFQSKNRVIGGYFLLLSAVVLLGIAAISSCLNWNFIHSAIFAKGIVVQMRERRGQDGNITYAPVVSFKDANNRVHIIEAHSSSSPPSHQLGDVVPVLYRNGEPENGRINEFFEMWGIAAFSGGFGILDFLIGCLLLVWPKIGARSKPSPSIAPSF